MRLRLLSSLSDKLIPHAEVVKNAFRYAWNGYDSYAFGHDEHQPVSDSSSDRGIVLLKGPNEIGLQGVALLIYNLRRNGWGGMKT
ncbi:hypothetical protein BX666DRAFT_1960457 [Dichotomocladium elegans]|nr:hypothetical protein BX666DRAFT_1960457 [Dichotomocladium elegans]